MNELVRCKYCTHQRSTGLDAWCDLSIKKHSIDKPINCDAFKSYHAKGKYKEIEFNENQIILWQNNNVGQRFTHAQFLNFLNEKIGDCND